jgi:hypothetical protein
VHVEAANPAATRSSSIRLYLSATPTGVNVTVEEFGFGEEVVTTLISNLDDGWHSLHLCGQFIQLYEDVWTVTVDGMELGTFYGFYAVQRDQFDPTSPYMMSSRVKFYLAVPPSNPYLVSGGFLFDDLAYNVWRSNDSVVLGEYCE